MTPDLPKLLPEQSQLAFFLHIPPDWNAEHVGNEIHLTGPAGLKAIMPNRKSDFTPAEWRAAAAAAILTVQPVGRKGGRVPMAEFLSLPDGWKATTFPSTIEMEGPNGERCGIPVPYNPTPREALIIAAHQSIDLCLNT